MPAHKGYRKSKRNGNNKYRKRLAYKNRAQYMSVPSGISSQRVVSMRYAEYPTITSTLGALNSIAYRANSIFDPNLTGSGHQPMGRDTWASLYNRYIVLGSKIRCTITVDTSQTQPFSCGVYLDDSSTITYTSNTEFIEAKKGTYRNAIGRQSKPLYVESKFSCKNFYNLKDVKDNLSRYGAEQEQNPTDSAVFHIWLQMLTASTDTISVGVVIDYIVLFSEPKTLDQS